MVRRISPIVRSLDTRSALPSPKRADPFYGQAAWQTLQQAIVAERGAICEDPKCDGRTHRPGMRVYADHIRELKDGGEPYERANIMLRCAASHTRKTAAERAERHQRRF